MSTAAKKYYSPQEYLAFERRADHKSEYYRGEMFAMAGASRAHNLITVNLLASLRTQLRNRDCEVYPSDMRVKIQDSGLYAYPDASACGQPQFEDTDVDTLLNPKVIVEVLSDSTQAYDRGIKFNHYRTIESLQEYVLIEQDAALVELYQRQDDGNWARTDFVGLAATAPLASIRCELPLAEVYEKVALHPDNRHPGLPEGDATR